MELVSVKGSFKRLEPYDGKLSRTVLRGRENSNISPVTRHYLLIIMFKTITTRIIVTNYYCQYFALINNYLYLA